MATKKTTAHNSTKATATKGRPAGLLTWVTAGAAVVIVAVLVILNVTKSSPSQTDTSGATTNSTIVSQLASVPASTFNSVAVTSSVIPITPPQVFTGKPALTYTVNGKKLPGVFYDGAEYCPYCAAERWSLIVALDRFGSFTGLRNTASSATDVSPNTPTFSFVKATYSSPYVAFRAVEQYDQMQHPLQTLSAADTNIIQLFGANSFPFVSIANETAVLQSAYSPSALAGLTRTSIAANLADPTNIVSQAIVGSANYLTAGICHADGQQPAKVCTSPGVKAAATALGLK